MKKLFIDTLGCQMNKSDTERIIGMLTHFGYTQTQNEYEADLFIVNTCAIRQLSVDKAYSRLGYWGKIKREKKEEPAPTYHYPEEPTIQIEESELPFY